MRAVLPGAAGVDAAGLRCPAQSDVDALGALMYRADVGTVDYAGETPADAVAEVRKTFAGEYGTIDPAHSTLAEKAGRLASATLITRWRNRPFVAFTMTDPEFARQGLARATLERSMRTLHQDGERELWLVVTLANAPARRLYESLSFVVEP